MKTRQKIIVAGAGRHGRVVMDLIRSTNQFDMLGYIDPVKKGELLGFPYLGSDEILSQIIRTYPECAAAIGVGTDQMNSIKVELFQKLKQHGFHLPALVHPSASVGSEVQLGEGTV